MNRIVKVGIALDQMEVSAWVHLLLQKIQQTPWADIRFVVLSKANGHKKKRKLWEWHLHFDKKRFQIGPNAASQKNIQALIPQTSTVFLTAPALHETINTQSPDLLIWLSESEIPAGLYAQFPCGIWSYRHGEHKANQEELLGYWEFIRMEEVIMSALVIRRSAKETGRMVYRSWSMMPSLSISRAKNEHRWKIGSFVPRALKELVLLGDKVFFEHLEQNKPIVNGQPSQKELTPSHWQALLNMGRHGSRLAHKIWRKLHFREQWILLFHLGQSPSLNFDQFKKIIPPKDRFWADPFLISQDDKHYLFFEELLYETDKGHICVMEIDQHGQLGTPLRVLEKDYHLSYPFIFEYKGTYYMIPESYQSGNIELHECTRFPDQWEHKMNLMEAVCAMDTTLLYHNDKWWLFTAMTETKGSSHHDELCLFYADSPLTTNWTPHPKNPIISDVRSARPAGNIYRDEGRLIRPSQDCARKYGFGFNLNEIEILTENDYRETRILHVRPDWDAALKRTHSFVHQKGITVIDGLIQRSKWF